MNKYKENGIVVKPFCYGDDLSRGTAAIILDLNNMTIDMMLQLSGAAPMAKDIILFLLADKDVRCMVQWYEWEKRTLCYSLRTSHGMSGRMDIYINFYNKIGLQIGGKKLIHISGCGKLNEGWGKMWIGDFVELVAYLKKEQEPTIDELFSYYESGRISELKEGYDLSKPRSLRRLSGCRYVTGYFCGNATCSVSKIL